MIPIMNAKSVLLTLGTSMFAATASPQGYSLDWITIGSGAGTSTNGNLVVSVTIGQAVANAGSGSGQYDFAGGFWTLFGFPTSEGTVTNYDYGVGFCSNQITGTLRFLNSNPAILSLLNAPGNEGMKEYYITARSTPAGRSSVSGWRPMATATSGDYAVTVDTGCAPGSAITYEVYPRVTVGPDEAEYYYFTGKTSAPVVVGVAGPVVNCEECLGVIQMNFVDSSGAPVSVNSGTIQGDDFISYLPSSANGVTQQRVYMQGGTPHQVNITLHRGTDVYTDRQEFFLHTNLTVDCDAILNVNIVVPAGGALGQITGTVDMLREFEWTVPSPNHGYEADLTGVIANYGPFYNQRWAAVSGDNTNFAASGTFTLLNVIPSIEYPSWPYAPAYAVHAEMLIRSNRMVESFWTPGLGWGSNPPVVVTPGASVSLSNIFQIDPGYVRGGLRLQGPAETPGHPSMLRGIFHCGDDDANHDHIPDHIMSYHGVYWSYVEYDGVDRRAAGARYTAANGYGWGDFDGSFDTASSSYLGHYELALGGLQGERSIWRPADLGLLVESPTWSDAPEDYAMSFNVQHLTTAEIEVVPGQSATKDLAYGFGEVIVRIYSPSATFSQPRLLFSGGLTGTNFLGQSVDYQVNSVYALGTPFNHETNHALVRLLLPEGSYTLSPSITVGGGLIGLTQIPITVAAGQRIDVGTCLRLDLTLPAHCSSNQVLLAGSVLTQCGNHVTDISYQVNGGATVTVCNNCGANPNFVWTVPLQVGANSLTVTARDDQGTISSISGVVQFEPPPPILTISLTPANTVVISWPSPSTGFTLQQSSDLGTANWVPVLETVNDNGTTRFVTLNPPAGKRFYRLIKASGS